MKKFIENKKGAVDLTDLAISIIVLGIVVSVGATILINMRDAQVSELGTHAVVNETVTLASGHGNLANYLLSSFSGLTNISSASGPVNGSYIPTSNYTTNLDSGHFDLDTSSIYYNESSLNASYTHYNYTDARYSVPNDASTGLLEYGNWFKIIVIVGIAAVLLSLIFIAFGRRGGVGESGGSPAY